MKDDTYVFNSYWYINDMVTLKYMYVRTYGTCHKKINISYLTLSAVRTVVRSYLAHKVIVVRLCYDRSTIVLRSLVRSVLRSLHTYVSVSAITILHKHSKHTYVRSNYNSVTYKYKHYSIHT